jgi:siroheme synthase
MKLHLISMIVVGFLVAGTIPGLAASVPPGKFYLVSTGPGDPKYLTLQAIDTMQKADLVLSHPQAAKKVAKYIEGKKVEDPWPQLWMHEGKVWMKDLHTYKPEERSVIVAAKSKERDEYVKKIQMLLAQGKNVVLLDEGDPTIYPRGFWLLEGMKDEQIEIVPGVGAMTASLAALKRSSSGAGARYVAQTAPFSFFGKKDRDDLARDLAKYPGTLIFYMGLAQLGEIVDTLKKFNPADLPIAVVYYAGYPEKEKVAKGTLNDIMSKVDEKEKWMGMIIVGKSLTGPHFVLLD